MARKVFDDTHISAIADRIRFNLDSTDTYTTAQMPYEIDRACTINFTRGQTVGREEGHEAGYTEGYNSGKSDGYSEGQTAEYDKFWDKLQQKGRRTGYRYTFYDWQWDDTIFNPKYPFICSAVSTDMFRYNSITDTKVPITFSHANSQYVFANNAYLKRIAYLEVTENVNFVNWFAGCTALEEVNMGGVIGKSIDFSPTALNIESALTILPILKDYSASLGTNAEYICEIKFPTSLWTELDRYNPPNTVISGVNYADYPTWYEYLYSIGWKPNYTV